MKGESLGQDWKEGCSRYKKKEQELVCLQSTLDSTSLLAQGLNEDARMEYFGAISKTKKRRDELRDEIGRITKETNDIGEVKVYDKEQVRK